MLPSWLSPGVITLFGVVVGVVTFVANKKWDIFRWKTEKVIDWHRNLQKLFSQVISVGTRMKTRRQSNVELIDDLFPAVTELDAEVNTMPFWVRVRVDSEVRQKVRAAAGMAYHLAHIPQPERDEDSIAGVMYHYYNIQETLDIDGDFEVSEVLDVIGDVEPPDDVEMTEEEAEKLVEEFEEAAETRLDDWEELKVDELMNLPWEKIDQVLSREDRERLVEYCVDECYEQAFIEKPRIARNELEKSEEAIVG